MSHSKAPWKWETYSDGGLPALYAGGGCVCVMSLGSAGDSIAQIMPSKPNMALIAAAPDLLAALIHQCPCECRHEIWTDDFGNERDVEDVCQRCAAIAKAEGK